jgi:hypothetical protein
LEVCHDQLLQANDKPNLKATTLKWRGSKHLRCTVEVWDVRGSMLGCPRRNLWMFVHTIGPSSGTRACWSACAATEP